MSKKRNGRDILTSLQSYRYRPVPHFPQLPKVSYKTNTFALSLIEDRREHYPGLKPYNRPVSQLAVGKPARLKLIQNPRHKAPSQTKAIVAFQEPHKLPLCIRRKQRKQVLHAKGVAGSKNLKKPTRNEWSDVSCQS